MVHLLSLLLLPTGVGQPASQALCSSPLVCALTITDVQSQPWASATAGHTVGAFSMPVSIKHSELEGTWSQNDLLKT